MIPENCLNDCEKALIENVKATLNVNEEAAVGIIASIVSDSNTANEAADGMIVGFLTTAVCLLYTNI